MTKQQFLSQLAQKLAALDPAEREKILAYYAQMLDERIEDGMTEQQAVATMESVDAIAAEILEEHVPQMAVAPAQAAPKKRNGWVIAVSVVAILLAVMLVAVVIFGLSLAGCVTRNVLSTTTAQVELEVEEHPAPSHVTEMAEDTTLFDPAAAEFLKVEWEVGNVYITGADVQEITLHEEGTMADKHAMVLRTGNGGLTVRYAQNTVFRNISLIHTTDTKDLYVQIPASWMGAVTVDVNLGTVTVENGTYESLNIDADLGEVLLRNVDAKHILIDADLGNVQADVRYDTLEAYLAAGDLDLTAQAGSGRIEHADCDMGKITIEGDFAYLDADNDMGDVEISAQGKPSVIEADCDMGNINLMLPTDLGFTMESDSDMGSVDISIPVEQRYHGDDRIYLFGDGACRIELSCDMGSIDVRQG